MKGRWSIYQILLNNKKIEPYLLKTELFNKHSFYQNLSNQVTFRSCFNRTEINIIKVFDGLEQYKVEDGDQTTFLNGKAEVFHFLNKVCKTGQFYVLQDTDFLYTKKNQVELLVTVNRDLHSCWQVSDILDKKRLLDCELGKDTVKIIHEIAIESALCLEESEPKCSTMVLDIGLLDEHLWIRDIELHFRKSKWTQYQILSSIDKISVHLPKTQLATSNTFFDFIHKYKQVILKPCLGQYGIGVVQVSWIKDDIFEVHNERKILSFSSRKEIIDYLQSQYFLKMSYLVQQRVSLPTIDDCLFDSRVMVQREDNNGEWEITAKVAKVAAQNFIVSNVAKSILPLEEALEKSSISKEELLPMIDKICMTTTLYLGEYYPDITSIGIDIGIDVRERIWIFEANLVPDVFLFKRLEDKGIYEKIIKKKKR